jgi:hypothetical protein
VDFHLGRLGRRQEPLDDKGVDIILVVGSDQESVTGRPKALPQLPRGSAHVILLLVFHSAKRSGHENFHT